MAGNKDETPLGSRARKLEGRAKRRRFVQGTRAYTHAMTNSMARRADEKRTEPNSAPSPPRK